MFAAPVLSKVGTSEGEPHSFGDPPYHRPEWHDFMQSDGGPCRSVYTPVTNDLFNDSHLLICWPCHVCIIIKPIF